MSKKHKKWEELSDSEKIEQLKEESEEPKLYSGLLIGWAIFIVLTVFMGVSIVFFNIHASEINYLYNSTGLNISIADNTTAIHQTADNISNIFNYIRYFSGGLVAFIFIYFFVRYHRWNKKYKAFNKSIEVSK